MLLQIFTVSLQKGAFHLHESMCLVNGTLQRKMFTNELETSLLASFRIEKYH